MHTLDVCMHSKLVRTYVRRTYMFVRACVCVCLLACVRVCVSVRVRARACVYVCVLASLCGDAHGCVLTFVSQKAHSQPSSFTRRRHVLASLL